MFLKKVSLINSVAYRGDTRPPEEIFLKGLSNRQSPDYQWFKALTEGSGDAQIDLDPEPVLAMDHLTTHQLQLFDKGEKDYEPFNPGKLTYRVWLKKDPRIYVTYTVESTAGLHEKLWTHYITNRPVYRDGNGEDISPKTAVCLTLRSHVAPYFPIDGCTKDGGEWIWIYAVLLGAGYKTYEVQIKRSRLSAQARAMARAQEVAVEHVPACDIICAVRCWRYGKYPEMAFVLAPRICWNPIARNRQLCKNEILAAFDPYQSMLNLCENCEVTYSTLGYKIVFTEPLYAYHLWQR